MALIGWVTYGFDNDRGRHVSPKDHLLRAAGAQSLCLRLGTALGDILRLAAGSVDSGLLTWAAGSIPEARLFGLLYLAKAFASR